MEINLNKSICKFDFSGSVLVAKGDEILLNQGYGFADRTKQIPNTPKTNFIIGSTTKAITAIAIMKLYEDNLIDLDNYLNKYIPELSGGDRIKILHLLSHSSGLDREVILENDQIKKMIFSGKNPLKFIDLLYILINRKFNKNNYKVSRLFKLLKGYEININTQPGQTFSYSNFGFQLLGCIIERVSKMSYAQYIDKIIFKPLGMTNSGSGYNKKDYPNFALSYMDDGKQFTHDAKIDILNIFYSAGGLFSTTEDLYKVYKALHNYTILRKETIEMMFTVHCGRYGLGWIINEQGERPKNKSMDQNDISSYYDYFLFDKKDKKDLFESTGSKTVFHNGAASAFTATFNMWLDDDVFIVVLSNVANNGTIKIVEHEIETTLFENNIIKCRNRNGMS